MSRKSAEFSLARTVAIVLFSLHVAPTLRGLPYSRHHRTTASSAAEATSLELVLSSDVTDDGVRLEEEESKPIRFNYTLKVSGDSNHTLALAVCATVDKPDIAVATVSQEAIVPLQEDVTGAFDVTVRGLFLGRASLHVHFVVGHGGVRCGQPEAEGLQELLRVSENGKDREMAWNITRTSPHPQTPSSSLSSVLSSPSLSSPSALSLSSASSPPAASSSSPGSKMDKSRRSSSPSNTLPPLVFSTPFSSPSSSNFSSRTFPPSTTPSSSSSSTSSSPPLSSSSPRSFRLSSSASSSSFSSSPHSPMSHSSRSFPSSSPASSFSSSSPPSPSNSRHHSSRLSSSTSSASFSSPSSSRPSSSPALSSAAAPSSDLPRSSSFPSRSSVSSSSSPVVPSSATPFSTSTSSVLGVHSGRQYPVVVVRKEKVIDTVFTVVAVVLVVIINIGMGSELDISVVKATLRRPFAPVTGVFSQFIIMPLVAFGVTRAFKLDSGVALGFFALGCAPGGSVSNSFCYLLGGDVSLSITMTFVSTVAALGMVPLWLYTLGRYVSEESNIQVPFQNIIMSLLGLAVAVGIGLLLKVKKPRWARISVIVSKVFLGIMVVFMMTVGVYANLYIFSLMSPHVLAGAALMPYSGFLLGGLVAIILRFPVKHIVTIAVETGIQNTGIAILLMLLSLDHPDSDLSIVGPIASSLFTPIPLWIAVAVIKIRQRFCKKKSTTDSHDNDEEAATNATANGSGGQSRDNDNGDSSVPQRPSTTTSLWKKLCGKGDGRVRGGGTEAAGGCLCGSLCGLDEDSTDDNTEDVGRRRREEENEGQANEMVAKRDSRSHNSSNGRPPSSLPASKQSGKNNNSSSSCNGGYDNLALHCDQVDYVVADSDSAAARRSEFSGETEDQGGRPTPMTASESLYDVISVKSDMSTATATTTASAVRSEKQFSAKFSRHSSSSISRSPRSEGSDDEEGDDNVDETNI